MFTGHKKKRGFFDTLSDVLSGDAQKRKENIVGLNERRQSVLQLRQTVSKIQHDMAIPEGDVNEPYVDDLLDDLGQACYQVVFERDVPRELRQDIVTTTENMINIYDEDDDSIEWAPFYNICVVAPQATNLWRMHVSKFGHKNQQPTDMARLAPRDVRKSTQISVNGEFYVGKALETFGTFPVAMKDYALDDETFETPIGVYFHLDNFESTSHVGILNEMKEYKAGMLISDIANLTKFLQDAEDILLKQQVEKIDKSVHPKP